MATVTIYLNKDIKKKLDDIMQENEENISKTIQRCIRFYHSDMVTEPDSVEGM